MRRERHENANFPGGYTDPIPARRLLINLLNTLATNGWHLAAATDIAGEERNRDTLIFKSGPSMPRFFFAVMFHSTDKLRLIDAPNESVRQGFLQALQVGFFFSDTHERSDSLDMAIGYPRDKGKGTWLFPNQDAR